MAIFSKTTNKDSNQAFWINNNGKPLLMRPLKAREIVQLFRAINANIKATKAMNLLNENDHHFTN